MAGPACSREEVLIANGLLFTGLLWLKLDYEKETASWISWPVVFAPLWLNNLIGMYASGARLRGLRRRLEGLSYRWWPQASKNVAILSLESLGEDLLSVALKVVLAIGPHAPYLVVFTPLWLSAVLNVYLFYKRRPHIGAPVKPRFLLGMLVVSKLDGYNHLRWPALFAPLWFLLVLVTCAVLVFAMSARHILQENKKRAFRIACTATALVCVLCGVGLAELAVYLELRPDAAFRPVALTMIAAQFVTLLGAVGFSQQIRKYQADLEARRQGRVHGEADDAGDNDGRDAAVALEFIVSPEDVFVRESANLFRRLHLNGTAAAAAAEGSGIHARTAVAPQNPSSEVPSECLICCVEEGADLVLLNCGHGSFCETCCTELVKRNMCPLCRGAIAKVARLKAGQHGAVYSASIAEVEASFSSSRPAATFPSSVEATFS